MTEHPEAEQPGPGSIFSSELSRLLNEAILRLQPSRMTFTEEEALQSVWDAGYEVSPQIDARFVLAREADSNHLRHWRLWTHTLANDRLLDALTTGIWDGSYLSRMLADLDAADQVHYVFCPADPRFVVHADDRVTLPEQEADVLVSDEIRAVLDELAPAVLAQWQEQGAQPQTVQHITSMFGAAGWSDANTPQSWLLVRSWLRTCNEVARVGQDYWLPTVAVPTPSIRARLQVLPVGPTSAIDGPTNTTGSEGSSVSVSPSVAPNSTVIPGESLRLASTQWTLPLRTVHVLEGFVPVPAPARSAYPPRSIGEDEHTVVRGMWFESGDHIWLWLDRSHDRLYGPDLMNYLAWCEAGDILRVQWTSDVVILRIEGRDAHVHEEETRLVDRDALAELRGGLGESYRTSLQHILAATPEGLPFTSIVTALSERQNHPVHRGTIRAILAAGGFVHRDGRWFAAPDDGVGARKLRTALVDALAAVSAGEGDVPTKAEPVSLRIRAQVIQSQLSRIIHEFHSIKRP